MEILAENMLDSQEFVTKVSVSPDHRIRVFIDGDEGITIERCTHWSRYLEEYLETEELVPEKYILEVSSPGVDEPLVNRRQYHKNVGRKVEVKRAEGKPVKGKLVQVGEESLTIETTKKKIVERTEIQFEEILETKVKISFSK